MPLFRAFFFYKVKDGTQRYWGDDFLHADSAEHARYLASGFFNAGGHLALKDLVLLGITVREYPLPGPDDRLPLFLVGGEPTEIEVKVIEERVYEAAGGPGYARITYVGTSDGLLAAAGEPRDVAVLVLQSVRCKHWWPVPHSEDCLRQLLPEFCHGFPGSIVVLGEASSESDLARSCKESGVAYYVPRPFSAKALTELLASLVTPWRPIEEPFSPPFEEEEGARL